MTGSAKAEAAMCPTMGCGKRAVTLVREEIVVREYAIVGVLPDAVLVDADVAAGFEERDSEAVALVCPDGHHWPFSYGYLDWQWCDDDDVTHRAAAGPCPWCGGPGFGDHRPTCPLAGIRSTVPGIVQ